MTGTAYLLVGLGGAIGGSARFLVSALVGQMWGTRFPFGTLAVNVTGALVIGLVAGLASVSVVFFNQHLAHDFIITGLLGGYTTVSSFCLQTLNLVLDHRPVLAALNVAGSTILCLAAVAAGYVAVVGALS